jgi:hypothetical protein
MTSLVLSVDELQAGARLAGVPVPPMAADDDPDDPRVDLAALRGLAARGLVAGLADADPEPSGLLSAVLAALDEPDWLLDVEIDVDLAPDRSPHQPGNGRSLPGSRQHRRWNSLCGPGGAASVTALLGGLVHVDLDAVPDSAAELAVRCGLPDVGAGRVAPAPGSGSDGFEVKAAAHVEADALALAGELDAAVAALVAAGVPSGAASGWVAAVATYRSAAAVRLARRIGGGAVEERELRWLVGGDDRVWRIGGDGDVSRVSAVGVDGVRATLADLLQPAAATDRGAG